MKRLLFYSAVAVGIVVSLLSAVEYRASFPEGKGSAHRLLRAAAIAQWDLPKPRPSSAAVAVEANSEGSVLQIATDFLQEHGAELAIQPHHVLKPKVYESPLQNRVVYEVYDDDLWIEGLSLELIITGGKVTSVNNHYRPVTKGRSLAELPLDEIADQVATRRGWNVDPDAVQASSRVWIADPGMDAPEPGYVIPMSQGNPGTAVSLHVLVRARDAQIMKVVGPRAER